MSERSPLDVDAIAARARALPGGWEAFPDKVQIQWREPADDAPVSEWCAGRYLTVMPNDWHAGSEDTPPGLWEFLAAARDEVLALVAEVRRLRAELDARRAWGGLAADSRRYALPPAGSEATA